MRRQRWYDLENRVVVITGGSRGLGLELARRFGDEHARIAICARDEAELAEAAAELRRRNVDVLAEPCDVTDADQVARCVGQIRERFGRIDVLVNNAGIIQVGPAEQMTANDFDLVMATNFRGPLRLIEEVAPEMRRRGSGRIVNIASIGGLIPVPHLAPYCAAKHALVGLGTTLRGDLAREGVYLTTVCPGVIQTGSPRHALFKGNAAAEYEWFAATANAPGLAVPTGELAVKIIDATQAGDALLVHPWPAKLQASLHGLAAGVGTELAALTSRLLPIATGPATDAVPGHATGGTLPDPLRQRQEANATRFNQV